MKQKQIMLIAIAVVAFVALWMYSQSGNASPSNSVGVCSNQMHCADLAGNVSR